MSIHLQPNLTLEELAQRSLKKDSAAQRQLYEQLSPKMLALCCRYIGSREAAKDVMHDGFIMMFEKLETFSGAGSFEGWVRRIIVNTALSHLRKADALKYSEQVDQMQPHSLVACDEFEKISSKDILKCIAAMPSGFRAVFNLFAIEGYPHREIAQLLRISESTSRSQYARARSWLQEKLKQEKE
jgi:RNA polymerase sigma factor, sigma-70 family